MDPVQCANNLDGHNHLSLFINICYVGLPAETTNIMHVEMALSFVFMIYFKPSEKER